MATIASAILLTTSDAMPCGVGGTFRNDEEFSQQGCSVGVAWAMVSTVILYVLIPLGLIVASFSGYSMRVRSQVPRLGAVAHVAFGLFSFLRPWSGDAVQAVPNRATSLSVAYEILGALVTAITFDSGVPVSGFVEWGAIVASALLHTISGWITISNAPDSYNGEDVVIASGTYVAATLMPLMGPVTYVITMWMLHGGMAHATNRRDERGGGAAGGSAVTRESMQRAAYIAIATWLGGGVICFVSIVMLVTTAPQVESSGRTTQFAVLFMALFASLASLSLSRITSTIVQFFRERVLNHMVPTGAVHKIVELAAIAFMGEEAMGAGGMYSRPYPERAPAEGADPPLSGVIFRQVQKDTFMVTMDIPKLRSALADLAHDEALAVIHSLHIEMERLARRADAFRVEEGPVVPCFFLINPSSAMGADGALSLALTLRAAALKTLSAHIVSRRRERLLGSLRASVFVHRGEVSTAVTGHWQPASRTLGPAVSHSLRMIYSLTSSSPGHIVISLEAARHLHVSHEASLRPIEIALGKSSKRHVAAYLWVDSKDAGRPKSDARHNRSIGSSVGPVRASMTTAQGRNSYLSWAMSPSRQSGEGAVGGPSVWKARSREPSGSAHKHPPPSSAVSGHRSGHSLDQDPEWRRQIPDAS